MKVTTIKGDTVDLHPGVHLEDAMLRNLDLTGIDLTGSSIRESFFNESNLKNARLRECDLSGSVFYRTNLVGADLTGATLHRCYWNEVIHDSTTQWPVGFVFPTGKRALAETTQAPARQYFPTGLCTPGVIPSAEIDIEIPRPTMFVPLSIPAGKVSDTSHEQLLLRLAALFYRATLLHVPEYDDWRTSLYDFQELMDEEDREDVIFTHACLAFLAVGLRVENVLDQERIEVTFSPVAHTRRVVESMQFRLLVLLFEELCGVEHEDDPTAENARVIDPVSSEKWLFFEDLDLDLDVSRGWSDVDEPVKVTPRSGVADDADSEVLKCLLRYFFASEYSILRIDADEDLDPPEFDAKSRVFFEWSALIMWHLMGVETATRLPNGKIRAILKPKIDVEASLVEIGFLTDDDLQHELWEPPAYALRPHAGRFSGHLG